jgi:hypothetical protein
MSDMSSAYPASCWWHGERHSHELRVVPMPQDDEPRDFPATDQAIRPDLARHSAKEAVQ